MRDDETMRDDEKMDSEEFQREVADLHEIRRRQARGQTADTAPKREAGEEVPYAEDSPRDRGPEQARRAVDKDSVTGQEGGTGQEGMPEGQPSEVSSLQSSPLGGNDSVGTQEVTPPADLAQQRSQGPGHDYRADATNETAAEDVEVMPRKKHRADGDDREERTAEREERGTEGDERS